MGAPANDFGDVYVDGYRSPLFYTWRRELIKERAEAMRR